MNMGFPDKPVSHLLGSNGPIHAVTYSASPGQYILTGSADRTIRLYNPSAAHDSTTPATGRLIQTYAAHGYEVLSLAVAATNERFASAGGDRTVFLWDVASATTVARFGAASARGHAGRVNAVAFGAPDDAVVVSGSADTHVHVWDARAAASGAPPVQVLSGARDAVSAVAVHGVEIVAGSVDGSVRSYDVRTGRVVTDVVGTSVTALALARDGRAVLVAGLDSKLRLMDRERGTCLREYRHDEWCNQELRVQAVLGGGERYVVTGDDLSGQGVEAGGVDRKEGRVWAWDLMTGKVAARVAVPWGPAGYEGRRRAVGADGKEKERKNVLSCLAWQDNGWGETFCVGGTSGVVTVFGTG